MKDCKEFTTFKAKDLMREFSFFKVLENGNGFYVINERTDNVNGPFKTQGKAYKMLAMWWDEILDATSIHGKEEYERKRDEDKNS